MERVPATELKVGDTLYLNGLARRADLVELEQRVLGDWSLNCYVKAGIPVTVTVLRLTPNRTGYKVDTREGHTFTLSNTQKVKVL